MSSRPILGQLEAGNRVLFIRLRSMGDCVLTTPALRMLAMHRPDLEIAVMVDPQFAGVYEGLNYVILRPSIANAFACHPALCVNLHGGTRSALLTAASRANFRAGFAHFRHPYLYNVKIPRAQQILGEERPVHTAEHVASALFYLGLPIQTIPRADLHVTMPSSRPNPYAALHPFASSAAKTWPAANFVAVGECIKKQMHLEPIILAGPTDDIAPFADFQCVVNAPLDKVKALLQDAALFVGNDSGPAHIAAAFNIPLTVLFGPSDPTTWAPWQATRAQVVTSQGPINGITVDQVQRAIEACVR